MEEYEWGMESLGLEWSEGRWRRERWCVGESDEGVSSEEMN